jgi:hypothetical protein
MSTLSASVTLRISSVDSVPTGAAVGTPYTVPYQPADATANYLTSNGAGTAGYATKHAFKTGSAAAATVGIDLTALTCSDGTTGFSHLREYVVFNDHATAALKINMTIASSFCTNYVSGTSVTESIPAGSCYRMPSPLLANNGYTVDSTHRFIEIDPGASTITYRFFAIGD